MIYSKEIKEKYLGFDDQLLMLFGVPVLALLIHTIFNTEFNYNSPVLFFAEWLESIYYTGLHWLMTRLIIVEIRKRYADFESSSKRILLQVLLTIVFSILFAPLFSFFLELIGRSCDFSMLINHHEEMKMTTVLLITVLMVFIYEVIYFYHQLRKSILEKEAVKQAHIQSQWEGLRNQVNPHFLFNSMNTLMSIIDEDSNLAKQFLKRLSKVYRYILESREGQLIPLSEEMEFIHSYVFLQQERFKGKLEVKFDLPDFYSSYRIVPMSLQILFENAIKHNIISSRRPLTIEVYVTRNPDMLVVKNNLQRKEQVIDSTKLGLENLRKRYAFITREEIWVREEAQSFVVSIPLIHPDKVFTHASADY